MNRSPLQQAIQQAWLAAQQAQASLGNAPVATTNLLVNLAQMWTNLATLLIQVAENANADFNPGE